LLCAIFLILAYRLAGSPGDVWVEQAKPHISKVTWVVFASRGFAVGASSIVAGAVTGTPGEFALGLKIGLVAGSLSGLTNAFGPLVEWWADNLSLAAPARGLWHDSAPDRFLSAIRAIRLAAVQCSYTLTRLKVTVGLDSYLLPLDDLLQGLRTAGIIVRRSVRLNFP